MLHNNPAHNINYDGDPHPYKTGECGVTYSGRIEAGEIYGAEYGEDDDIIKWMEGFRLFISLSHGVFIHRRHPKHINIEYRMAYAYQGNCDVSTPVP